MYIGNKNVGSAPTEPVSNRFAEAQGLGVGFLNPHNFFRREMFYLNNAKDNIALHMLNVWNKYTQVYPESILVSYCFPVFHIRASANCNSTHSSEAFTSPMTWVDCVSLWAALGWGAQTILSLSESMQWNQSASLLAASV